MFDRLLLLRLIFFQLVLITIDVSDKFSLTCYATWLAWLSRGEDECWTDSFIFMSVMGNSILTVTCNHSDSWSLGTILKRVTNAHWPLTIKSSKRLYHNKLLYLWPFVRPLKLGCRRKTIWSLGITQRRPSYKSLYRQIKLLLIKPLEISQLKDNLSFIEFFIVWELIKAKNISEPSLFWFACQSHSK